MALLSEDLGAGQVRFDNAGETLPPTLGHFLGRAHRGEIAHTAQRILTAAVDDTLRLNGLAAAQGGGF